MSLDSSCCCFGVQFIIVLIIALVLSGSFLTGKIGFIGDEPGKASNTYPLTYTLGPSTSPASKKDKFQVKEKEKEKSFVDAMKDAKLAYLLKSGDLCEEDAVKMFEELLGEFNKDLHIYCSFVNYMSSGTERQKKYRDNIVKWCEKGLSLIDRKELLAYYGCEKSSRHDLISDVARGEDDASMEGKSVMTSESEEIEGASFSVDKMGETKGAPAKWKDVEKQKDHVIQLLQNQLSALITDSESNAQIEVLWKRLKTFCDPFSADSKTLLAVTKYCRHHKLYGSLAIKLLRDMEDNCKKISLKNLADICHLLGWTHVVERLENSTLLVRYPPNYAPF